MRQHAVVIHAFRELIEGRHVHCFGSVGTVERTIATISDLDSSAGKERISVRNSLVMAQLWLKSLRELTAVHLLNVEDGIPLGKQTTMGLFVIFPRLLLVGSPVHHG
jgi:hypothetical protein